MTSYAASGYMASPGGVALMASNPFIGFAVLSAAALFDAYVLYPAIQGKGRNRLQPNKLAEVPANINEAGAPRVWAMGRRVRVPAHTLWQDEKVRETTTSNTKAGTTVPQRRVYFDCLLAINDRKSVGLTQLIGNGKPLLLKTLNFIDIESTKMIVSVSGGRLILTMASTLDPDFKDKFRVNDGVKLSGFAMTAGQDVNTGYWKVAVVTSHAASAPSKVELDPWSAQTVAGIAATAGTAFNPAKITRVDDVLFATQAMIIGIGAGPAPRKIGFLNLTNLNPQNTFVTASDVVVTGAVAPYTAINRNYVHTTNDKINTVGPTFIDLLLTTPVGTPTGPQPETIAPANNPAKLSFIVQPKVATGFFPPTFDPDLHYHDGSDDQGEDALLAAKKGTGQVPAYRGVACQAIDDMFVEYFGGTMPFSVEAIVDVDQQLTWASAISLLLERGQIPAHLIDTTGIPNEPFLGFWTRGSVPPLTAMQPLLIAGGIIGQDRNGVVTCYDVASADIVDVRNDATLSDLACAPEGTSAPDEEWVFEDTAEEDLPSSVAVKHQDPDNQYKEGYQHFGLRNPSGVKHRNEVELDLSSMVLTRKQAREVAMTHMRREWVNRRRVRFCLGPNYADLLENDIVRGYTKAGDLVVARIIQIDHGSDERVTGVAVVEDLNLPPAPATTVSAAASVPPAVETATRMDAVVLDIPALGDSETTVTQLRIAARASGTGAYAGASVWQSLDGSTFTLAGMLPGEAKIGELTADLPVTAASEQYGTTAVTHFVNSISVEFGRSVLLSSVTPQLAEAGANWIALITPSGEVEIAAFESCVATSATSWDLGNLLRGLRGTRPVSAVAGTKLVVLDSSVMRLQFQGTINPQAIAIRVVPAGTLLEDAESVQVNSTWRNVLPLPVRKVTKTIDLSPFDARFTVTAHWCKLLLPLGTQPPHPMDDPPEGYRLTIYDPTGSFPIRVKELRVDPTTGSPTLRDAWFDYPASEQTADGYVPSAVETFWIDIQQMSGIVPVAPYPSVQGLGPSIKQEI